MNAVQLSRYNRLAKQRERNSKRSFATEVEDLKICFAWEAGELSEGQAVKALGYDRVTCRKIQQDAIRQGRQLFTALAT